MAFTDPPEWATDANYDAGANAWNGNPTKRAPSAGEIAKGKEPGETFFAQVFNYLMNALAALFNAIHSTIEVSVAQFKLTASDTYPGAMADAINIRATSVCMSNWTLLTPNLGGATAKSIGYIDTGSVRRIVVGCTNGAVYTSDNYGSTWTSRTSNTTKSINAWALSPGPVLVGVCNDGEIISTSDGATYTARTSGAAGTPDIFDVCWSSSNSLFVAVGEVDPTNAYIATSPTGVTWTKRAFSVTGANANLVSVAAAPSSATVIATSTANTFASSNATTWGTNGVDIASFSNHERVVYVPHAVNPRFMVIGTNAGGTATNIATSTDGVAWLAANAATYLSGGLVVVPFLTSGSAYASACAFTTVGVIHRQVDPADSPQSVGTPELEPLGYRPGSYSGFASYVFGRVFAPSGAADQLYQSQHMGAYN